MQGSHITREMLLQAYAAGVFPMADGADDDDLYWVDPEMRGILPLDGLIISRSLRKTIRSDRFHVTANRAFTAVLDACAEAVPDRPSTWINADIKRLVTDLHNLGFAHSVECWQNGDLVGGLYGVHIGGAFFGESMFHRARDASKTALVHLVARLRQGGFTLLDTQFVTDHLISLGAVEIPRDTYLARLQDALPIDGDYLLAGDSLDGTTALQLITQTS